MTIDSVTIPEEEKVFLKKIVEKNMLRIVSPCRTDFSHDFVDRFYMNCEDTWFQIDREDIVAMLFDEPEDGGRPKISESKFEDVHGEYTKNINRVVKGVSIITDSVEFKKDPYRLTYPKAIIFHFDDCNLIVEKLGIFSLAGLIIHLEPLDAENFGLCDELGFWYQPDDPEVFPEKPIFTQNIEKL